MEVVTDALGEEKRREEAAEAKERRRNGEEEEEEEEEDHTLRKSLIYIRKVRAISCISSRGQSTTSR